MEITVFFFTHWFGSLFFQTFFLHRYASHGMFTMTKFWERTFYILTYIFQGTSFLNPRAYAIMHRLHHAFSDTERDPHSPHYFRSIFSLMMHTKDVYLDLINNKIKPGENFSKNIISWPAFDRFADRWTHRIFWAAGYTSYYILFSESWWLYGLLPIHYLMGPIHGAIVNWCGHKYGYRNFNDTRDHSRNTLFFDFLTMGELFQNNHHKYPGRANFATRIFEIDPTYPVLKLFNWLGIIKLKKHEGLV